MTDSKKNFFQKAFKNNQSVFKMVEDNQSGESVFSTNYIPDQIWHREDEMRQLVNYFRSIITHPTTSNRRVILYGVVGTGKTVLSRAFAIQLSNFLKEQENSRNRPNFRFFHVNCRKTKTPHLILTTILRQLVPGFPLRGFSVEELLRMFTLLLYEQNLVSLLILDEIDYLIPDERIDFLYALSRIEESPPMRNNHHIGYSKESEESRFNLLTITRDPNFRYYLDDSTSSSLGKNIITFPPYTRNQLFDIISSRAEKGLQESAYDDELLEVIASLAEENGDARFAIELLWRAAKLADQDFDSRISAEHIRRAMVSILPMEKSIVEDLNIHQKLLLLSIAKILSKDRNFVTTPVVQKEYQRICEEANIHPRRQTQIWSYLKDLGKLGLIQQEVENRHRNGKSCGRITKISIRDLPLEEIKHSLGYLIENNSVEEED